MWQPCLATACLVWLQALRAQPLLAPLVAPPGYEVENGTFYFVDATCFGVGKFSGKGTADTMPSGIFTTPGGAFDGAGIVNSTSGIWNGEKFCATRAMCSPLSMSFMMLQVLP